VGSIIGRYLARASVAVPFLIAGGFAIAAITLMLVERYGQVAAYWIMAGALAVMGALAALVVTVKEQEEDAAEQAAETSETTASSATAAVAEAAAQNPMALLTMLSALPAGPASIVPVLRMVARNLPLVVLLAAITFLVWPKATAEADQDAAAGVAPESSGVEPAPAEPTDDDISDEGHVRHKNGVDPLPSQMRH
jgi:hypothetical protein